MSVTAALKRLSPAPAGSAPGAARPESTHTLKFAWHPWDRLDNRKTHGVRFGMPGEYAYLPRMELIYLPALNVPKLRPKNSGFAVGKVTQFGISAAAAVGSDVDILVQYPSQLAEKLKKAFGERGLAILESLTAETDAEKEESILVYHAVMKTAPEGKPGDAEEASCGVEVVMEDLPLWLEVEAPQRLAAALKDGVEYEGVKYTLKPSARQKGLGMIEEMRAGIKAANQTALVVLKKTKKELTAASKGINDSKAIADQLDEFLLHQHPSFSLDTEVERAGRAAAAGAKAARAGGTSDAMLDRVLEQNERLIQQNSLLFENNTKLSERLTALEKAQQSQ